MTIADTVSDKLKTASPEAAQEVLAFLALLEAKAKQDQPKPPRSWDEFMGCRAGSQVFDGDPVEIQRKMRAEWDREWDK